MKKKNGKRVFTVLLALVLTLSVMVLPAAAADRPETTGAVDNIAAEGRVAIDGDSATAVTTFGEEATPIVARATVYYTLRGNNYYSTANTSHSGTTAVAVAQQGFSASVTGVLVIGGEGSHDVYYHNDSWHGETWVGSRPADAQLI